ncbi:MAG: hypothetical protein ACJAXR_002687 [Halopseudomonas sp.]|jgi:hypothetical protein|uniref:amidoligase family protein n=1 Tax=Halopseudomonas sp. TaxID=2901191 RepID=UPI0039E3BDA9
MTKIDAFTLPPWQKTAEGQLRRVGVELEMNGLELDEIARLAAEFLGCTVETTSRYERSLRGDPAGEWIVELDFALLKKMGREERIASDLGDEIRGSAEDVIKWFANGLVPHELVSPPLPLNRLGEVDELIAYLREAGAKGTGDRATNAFGMQFNPEVPACKANIISAYLKAFLCLFDWLSVRADINMTRRLTSYVDPFPGPYVKKLVQTDYWPDMAGLIDDYLEANPTRNRALDMLPLFKHIDEQRVLAKVSDELIKSRPTFHYRLPDCLIDQPGWGVHIAWNDWVEVERLAADPQRLEKCCRAYAVYLDKSVGRLLHNWEDEVQQKWLSGAT